MGVEIKFTDKDLPVSPGFIEFLHHYIDQQGIDTSWHDQVRTCAPYGFPLPRERVRPRGRHISAVQVRAELCLFENQ